MDYVPLAIQLVSFIPSVLCYFRCDIFLDLTSNWSFSQFSQKPSTWGANRVVGSSVSLFPFFYFNLCLSMSFSPHPPFPECRARLNEQERLLVEKEREWQRALEDLRSRSEEERLALSRHFEERIGREREETRAKAEEMLGSLEETKRELRQTQGELQKVLEERAYALRRLEQLEQTAKRQDGEIKKGQVIGCSLLVFLPPSLCSTKVHAGSFSLRLLLPRVFNIPSVFQPTKSSVLTDSIIKSLASLLCFFRSVCAASFTFQDSMVSVFPSTLVSLSCFLSFFLPSLSSLCLFPSLPLSRQDEYASLRARAKTDRAAADDTIRQLNAQIDTLGKQLVWEGITTDFL